MYLPGLPERRGQGRCVAVVALMLSLWLAPGVLQALPALHQFLHQDAQNPSHRCLVIQFQHQLLLPGLVAPAAPLPGAGWSARAPGPPPQLLPAFDYVVSDGRAPPPSPCSTAVGG